MLGKIKRLFTIRTRFEAFLLIYALALGATTRGAHYVEQYPGWGGYLLFLACTGAVFLAGAKILDCLRYERSASFETGSQPAASSPPQDKRIWETSSFPQPPFVLRRD